jgi:hypothetical protein
MELHEELSSKHIFLNMAPCAHVSDPIDCKLLPELVYFGKTCEPILQDPDKGPICHMFPNGHDTSVKLYQIDNVLLTD